jgi:predicted PurR-regulated permease PerM
MDDKFKNISINITTKTIINIVLIGFVVLALFKIVDLVLIILVSIVVASFIEGGVKRLRPYLKNRTLIVFLMYTVSISLIVGLLSVFMPVFIEEMSLLVSSLSQYIPNNSILNSFQPETISGAKEVFSNISKNASIGDVVKSTQTFISSLSGGFMDIFGGAFGGLVNFGLIVIISFYLSITERGVENFLRIITPKNKEDYVIDLWRRTERKIGLWAQGQLLLGLIIGVLSYLGLTILGVKYSLVLAIITAFCELIPFGIFLAMILAAVFGFIDGGITLGLLSASLFFVLHQFENYLIYPLIVKKVIGISPLVVILSIIIGLELAGFMGVLLAIPVAVFILELISDLEKRKD